MKQGRITLAGVVQKLIDRNVVNEPQQAQISLSGADYLYDELRVANVHEWEIGKCVENDPRALATNAASSQGDENVWIRANWYPRGYSFAHLDCKSLVKRFRQSLFARYL